MEKIRWEVSNITCATCAHTIQKSLEKDGQKNIQISIADGRVAFDYVTTQPLESIQKNISNLGYNFKKNINQSEEKTISIFSKLKHSFIFKFYISLIFTLPLMLHMFVHIEWLMNPYLQLCLASPVFLLGIYTFGKSAYKSVLNGFPNMDVLVVLGASSAYVYSVIGCFFLNNSEYLFFETTASIFTLVFLGNWLEHRTIQITQREIKKLIQSKPEKATMIAFDENQQEQFFEINAHELRVGDLIVIKSGDKIPADAKILWGELNVNESLITGESEPLLKQKKDLLVGGSLVENGNAKAQVVAVGDNSVLGIMIQHIRDAELNKPPIQKLADKISAIFVPLVLFIAGATFLFCFYYVDLNFESALMRSIAVLVIACPCALGLATPAAIAVGLGRAAKNGILFREAKSLEVFKNIKQLVFDKTGTLTTGKLKVENFYCTSEYTSDDFKHLVYSIEKYSNHPIAHSICKEWHQITFLNWKNIQEIKGVGIEAEDEQGNHFKLGSKKIVQGFNLEGAINKSLYVIKNNKLIGWVNLQDEIRPEAKEVINYFQQKNIRVLLISGDNEEKCKLVADNLEIKEFYAEQTPEQKIEWIKKLERVAPTAMVGDGINDAPALAQASVGISINGASQISIEAASVVLMNANLIKLPLVLNLGKQTYSTIKENLFWAFTYNIIAIPFASMGYLSPTWSALIMGGSDVVLAFNSARLYFKKIK